MTELNLDELTTLIKDKKFNEAKSILEPYVKEDEKHIEELK